MWEAQTSLTPSLALGVAAAGVIMSYAGVLYSRSKNSKTLVAGFAVAATAATYFMTQVAPAAPVPLLPIVLACAAAGGVAAKISTDVLEQHTPSPT
jgi:riboflavin transporter FmnP